MATETFYKRIILSDEAAERLAIGLDKALLRDPQKVAEENRIRSERSIERRRRGQEWLKNRMSASENSPEQTKN